MLLIKSNIFIPIIFDYLLDWDKDKDKDWDLFLNSPGVSKLFCDQIPFFAFFALFSEAAYSALFPP